MKSENQKTEDFKFQIAGPFQPIEWEPYQRAVPVATLKTALELARLYRSILGWRSHHKAMSKSIRHVATMMGEVDDPNEEESYNPLAYAGLFGIFFVIDTTDIYDSKNNRKLPDRKKEATCGVITQLLLAFTYDDDALAQYVRYIRTGYIGSPSGNDVEKIQECREFIRKVARRSEEMEQAFLSNQYDIPLQKRLYGYDRERGHYWSQPIEIPHIDIDEETEY